MAAAGCMTNVACGRGLSQTLEVGMGAYDPSILLQESVRNGGSEEKE